jgi:hypothetical protein
MAKLLGSKQIEERARELGVDVSGELRTQSSSGRSPRAPDFELQRRVIEAERSIRESRLWILAVISAVASVLSAIVALVAVMKK